MEDVDYAAVALEELEDAHISLYNLSVYSFEQMKKEAGNIIITKSKTTEEVLTSEGGINDKRMGTLGFTDTCKTCSAHNCPGHMGIILFGKGNEICHPLFIKTVVKVLNCVCQSCSRVLFCKEVDNKKIMSDELRKILGRSPENRLNELENYCLKDKNNVCQCDYSKKKNVGKCRPNIKIKSTDINDKGIIQPKTDKGGVKTFHIAKIIQILSNISVSDAKYLGFIGDTQPIDLIMQAILVIPPLARPPTTDKNGVIIQNPLTTLYLDIVKAVNKVPIVPGNIYLAVKSLIVKHDNNRKGGQEIKSISDLQKGKKGVNRQALMGKRTDFCCRSVAGPGEHLAFGQEVLPLEWSYILTKPVKVTKFNADFLNNLLTLKRVNHISDEKGVRITIDYTKPLPKIIKHGQLSLGQQVEIQLKEKDRIYLNRQPSLTKGSMMGFEIVFEEGQVIKSHLSITTSLNLDHDGDELNVWVPQDYEVEAELEYVMNAKNCLISTASGKANMGLVMNSVTAAHLLSLPGAEISEELYFDLISTLTNKEALPTLNERFKNFGFELYRTDNKNVKHYNGRAALSALFPSDFIYKHKGVNIFNGILVDGTLTKAHIGPTSRSIVQELVKNYGINRASDFLTDAPHLLNLYISNRGFSVGISDCENVVVDSKAEEVNLLYNKSAQIFNTLYNEFIALVFSKKTYFDLPIVITKAIDIIDNTMRQSYDSSFKRLLKNDRARLERIRSLIEKVGSKKCQGSNTIIEEFKKLKDEKVKIKKFLEESVKQLIDLVSLFEGKIVSDPFLIQLRNLSHHIEVGYLLVGEQFTFPPIQLKVASVEEVTNQVIVEILNLLKTDTDGQDVQPLLSKLDKTLRTLVFEGISNYVLYEQLYSIYRSLKSEKYDRYHVKDFLDNLPKKIINLKSNLNIVEEDVQIKKMSESFKLVDEYEMVVNQFINTLFVENTLLVSCLLNEQQMKLKNNSILGQFNELLLLITTLLYKNLKNVLSAAYNKNFVVTKEELAKTLLDVKALGSKKDLSPKEAEFKELQLMEKLNVASTIGATLAGKVAKSNAIIAQTETGAGTKGSSANVGQIMGAIGQQYMSGQRLWNDKSRLSSHFDEDDESPDARGLIESSFLEGLTPTEMFLIQAAGRESVIETYMNTPTIGKLQRFMERALENVIIGYDGSVRNNVGFLYSPSYNMGFGIDKMLAVGSADKPALTNFLDINLLIDKNNQDKGWYSINEIKKTNIKLKPLSLEAQFTEALKEKVTVKPIAIKSQYQNAEQKLTVFEKARLLGIRAQMLNENDEPRVDIGELVDALDIAKLEYEQGALAEEPALFIIRTLPNGQQVRVYPTLQNII